MAISVTITGARRINGCSDMPVLLVGVLVGTSYREMPFQESDLLRQSSASAMATYVANQALCACGVAAQITELPTGLPDIRSTVSLTGSQPVAGFSVTQRTATTDTTLASTDYCVWCNSTGGNIVVTLPTAVGVGGTRYEVKKIVSANTVTVTPAGAETIDGASTLVLSLNGSATVLTSNNANWVHTPGVAAQVGASQTGVASIADAPAKAAITAIQAALFAEGAVTNPA